MDTQRWVFICLHGAAKSIMAAAYCRRLAAERGAAVEVASGGIEPDPGIPPTVVAGLLADGIDVRGQAPRRVTREDLAAATRVIAFGCDLTQMAPPGLPVEDWADVPPASEDFAGARTAILSRLEALFEGDRERPNAAAVGLR